MLQSIHDSSKGWLTWVVVLLVSFAFILFGTHDYFMGSRVSDIAATVNGTEITQSQLTHAYQRTRQAESASTPAADTQLKREVLQQLISNQALTQAATAAGLRFSFQQSIATLHAMPAFQQQGQFSLAKFQDTLRQMSYTEQSFMDELQSTLLI